jgi:tape measure domain-containing protein
MSERLLLAQVSVDITRLERAMKRAGVVTEQAAGRMEQKWEKSTRRMSASSDRFSLDVRRFVAGTAVALAGRELISYADQWTQLGNKVAAAGEISKMQGRGLLELGKDAAAARSKVEPYVDLYSRLLRASEGVAKSEAEVAKATSLVSKAFAAGGATAAEASGGILQLGQALGSGQLQGDELRALKEAAPLVAKAIADSLGVSVGALKKLGAEGKLTSKVVFRALLEAEDMIEGAFGVTLPVATGAASIAFDQLGLKIGKFIEESGEVRAGSEALASVIDFVANNLEAFASATIIAGAALSGALGAQVLLATYNGLIAITGATRGFAAAMLLLRAASAFLLGPAGIIIAFAALSAGLAAVAIHAKAAADEFDDLRTAATTAGSALKTFTETGSPTILQQQAVDLSAIKAQYYGIAAAAIAAAEAEKERRVEALLAERQKAAAGLGELESRRGNRNLKRAGNLKKRQGLDRDIELARNLLNEYDAAIAAAANTAIPSIADQLASGAKSGGGADSGLGDVQKQLLKSLQDAYNEATESESQQIKRVYAERLAAIDGAKLSQSVADEAKRQAQAVYFADMGKLNADAEAAAKKRYDEDQKQAAQEIDFLGRLADSRDYLFGRFVSMSAREYEARRADINANIEDEVRRAEALAILAEEEAENRRLMRNDAFALDERSDPEAEAQLVIDAEALKLEYLRDALEQELITRQEYADLKKAIEADTEAEILAIRTASAQAQFSSYQSLFGGLAGLAQAFAGKSSGIYKALFLAEKAAALGSAYVAMNLAVAKANASAPYPFNLPAITAAKVQGISSIVGIAASTVSGFKSGGYTGAGDPNAEAGVVHRGEYVFDAKATRRLGVDNLRAIAAGNVPAGSIPVAKSGGRMGGSFSFGDTVLTVSGNGADEIRAELSDTLAAHRAGIIRDVQRNFPRMLGTENSRTTPRHERGRL